MDQFHSLFYLTYLVYHIFLPYPQSFPILSPPSLLFLPFISFVNTFHFLFMMSTFFFSFNWCFPSLTFPLISWFLIVSFPPQFSSRHSLPPSIFLSPSFLCTLLSLCFTALLLPSFHLIHSLCSISFNPFFSTYSSPAFASSCSSFPFLPYFLFLQYGFLKATLLLHFPFPSIHLY